MAQQSPGGFRRFLQTGLGRIVLILIAVAITVATYSYVSVVAAIPAILLFGLAVPIWVGLKRPRYLAIGGLVIVLTVAPISSIVVTQLIFEPVGAASSGAGGPFSSGQPIMQNATVSPYTGSTSTNFTWTVTIYPQWVPQGNTTPSSLQLYISTCPGATGNSSPNCSQPYPFTVLTNDNLPNQTTPYTVTFHYQIGTVGIWDWQMGLYTNNSTTKKPYYQVLVGDPTYNGIEGPVVGTFADIYSELILTVYFQDFLFLGAPFYFILLLYMLFKNRERRRREAQQRAPGPVPPDGGVSPPSDGPAKDSPLPSAKKGAGGTDAGVTTRSAQEFNCPKCNAVVYQGETTCWKCGSSLPQTSSV